MMHLIDHHAVETVTGFVPVTVVTAAQVTQTELPPALIWLSYAAALSTLLLNVPRIVRGFRDMMKPGQEDTDGINEED